MELLLVLAAICFSLWRTHVGALAGFATLLATALLVRGQDNGWSISALTPLVAILSALVVFGLATIVVTARLADHARPSHRFMSAVLAAIGTLAVGVSLAATPSHRASGSAIVAGGTAFLLGAVPGFAWAPLLIRHEHRVASALGVVAFIASAGVALWVPAGLPDPLAARWTFGVLGAVSAPWALWHAARQRREDPRCARSYVAAAAGALLVLLRAVVV